MSHIKQRVLSIIHAIILAKIMLAKRPHVYTQISEQSCDDGCLHTSDIGHAICTSNIPDSPGLIHNNEQKLHSAKFLVLSIYINTLPLIIVYIVLQ